MSENYFATALKNFTMDAAAGDAIRHLTDKGFTFSQVKEALTFPAPDEYIAEVMWGHLVSKGTVLFDNPVSEQDRGERKDRPRVSGTSEIVEQRDRYGRKSFVSVKKSPEETIFSPEDYVQYKNFLVLKHAQEQVSSLSDHIPLKVRNTGSRRDM